MVVKLYPPWVGGLESHVAQLSRAIQRERPDVRVAVVTGQESAGPRRSEMHGGVQVHRARTLARVARTPICLGIRSLIEETRPDVVHFHTPFPWGEMVAPLSGRFGVVVTYYHDVVRQRHLRRLYAPVVNRLLRRADRIVAWSNHLLESSDTLRPYRHKAVISAGGIETARFAATDEIRRRARDIRARHAPHGPLVLFVGRLVYHKGLDVLLRAMASVRATLLVVGSGDLQGELERQASVLKITDRVRFLSDVSDPDLPAYYHASDLLVLPSTANTETFGLVQVEAHASGIPTICTALPTGVTRVNEHGVTGLVVPVGDSEALGAAINQLLGDDALRRAMGTRAQRRAVEQFDIGRCARDMLSIYDSLPTSSRGAA